MVPVEKRRAQWRLCSRAYRARQSPEAAEERRRRNREAMRRRRGREAAARARADAALDREVEYALRSPAAALLLDFLAHTHGEDAVSRARSRVSGRRVRLFMGLA